MRRLSIPAILLMAAVPARAEPPAEDLATAVVLFGAHWCAPCAAEYRDLPGLAAAAAPARLVLAWIDRPAAAAPPIRSLPSDTARELARSLAGEGYGLPFAVMFDARARPCAMRRGPLRADDLAPMRAQCGSAGSTR